MKKLIYSLAIALTALTSCNKWDDAVTETYSAGPDISISIVSVADSSFQFMLTPAEGTQFYNFIIDQNDTPEALDSAYLLKGSYGNTANLLNAAEKATFTAKVKAEPNTTYQVYAVAASDKGKIGHVAVASVTTTDQYAPQLTKDAFTPVPASKAVTVDFDQSLVRGTGAVSAVYYKEWDWENPVTVPADDIKVTIDGSSVTLAAPTTPDGAIVAFSWEAGAFTDAKGNKCAAFNTVYDEEEDEFIGATVQNKKVAFEIADDYVTAPEDGALFGDWQAFKAELTFDFDVFRLPESMIPDGAVMAIYTNANRQMIYKLKASQWSVEGKQVILTLPVEPMAGDEVTFSIGGGWINDVYGNGNAAKDLKASWVYFTPTKDMVLGTFDFIYYSAYDDEPTPYNGGPVTISENEEIENGLIIKGLFSDFVEGTELDGSYDLSSGKLYIDAYQALGKYTNSKGAVYGLVLYSQTYEDLIEFTINADGTITSTDCGLVAYDENFQEPLGWFEKASSATFAPTTEAARSLKKNSSKTKKLGVHVRNLKTRVRK